MGLALGEGAARRPPTAIGAGVPNRSQERVSAVSGASEPLPKRNALIATWLIIFFAAAILYSLTAQRNIGWQDTGWYQMRSIDGNVTTGMGLAVDHPLYIVIGHLLSLLGPQRLPLLLNLWSGLAMAAALANLGTVLFMITKRWTTVAVVAVLATCHTIWWLSTVAEVYAPVVAGFTVELLVLYLLLHDPRGRYVAALAFVNGVGLCFHDLALLPLPVYVLVTAALVRQRRLPPWTVAAFAGAWTLGAGYFLILIVRAAIHSGSLLSAVSSALFAGRWSPLVLGTARPDRGLLVANLGLIGMNFANVLLPLAVLGWLRFRSTLGGLGGAAYGLITFIHVLFVSRYFVADQFTFMGPSLVMIAFAAGIGFVTLASRSHSWNRAMIALCCASAILQPLIIAASPAIASRAGVSIERPRPLKYRDEARYWLIPWKANEDSAFRWAREALARASQERGIIIADATTMSPLLFVQRYYGVGRSATVLSPGCGLPNFHTDVDAFREAVGDRPLFVLSNSSEYVRSAAAELQPVAEVGENVDGLFYRLRWRP
ncbi:MAG: protein O-mannosyl-transferase family [Candidatus Eisenbacteria bacterium]